MNFREIYWPYETHHPIACPECRHAARADATVKHYWNDAEIEFRCRKCFHQWTLVNVDYTLAGKQFTDGERVG